MSLFGITTKKRAAKAATDVLDQDIAYLETLQAEYPAATHQQEAEDRARLASVRLARQAVVNAIEENA